MTSGNKLQQIWQILVSREEPASADQEFPEQGQGSVYASRNKPRSTSFFILMAAVLVVAGYWLVQLFIPNFSDNSRAITKSADSVVILYCLDEDGNPVFSGSGFLAFEPGVIVTNFHVAREGKAIVAVTEQNQQFRINSVIGYDPINDIALLRSSELYLCNDKTLRLLKLGHNKQTRKGDTVVAIGSPLTLKNSVSTGVISSIYTLEDQEWDTLQFTAAISQGSSGGALFNDRGQVIGVTSACFVDGQNVNLAVSIEAVKYLYGKRNYYQDLTMTDFYQLVNTLPDTQKDDGIDALH